MNRVSSIEDATHLALKRRIELPMAPRFRTGRSTAAGALLLALIAGGAQAATARREASGFKEFIALKLTSPDPLSISTDCGRAHLCRCALAR